MIKNQKQLSIEKDEAKDLADLIKTMEIANSEVKMDFIQNRQYVLFKGRLKEISKEIEEYERLTSNNLEFLEFCSEKDDIKKAIMCFRIASGLTQKDIADKIEIHESQIQRYEQRDYLNASFERIIQLLNVLGVEIVLKKTFKPKKHLFLNTDEKASLIQEKAKQKHCLMTP